MTDQELIKAYQNTMRIINFDEANAVCYASRDTVARREELLRELEQRGFSSKEIDNIGNEID